ncbi:MAG: hypothetical protein ACI8WB_000737 [Phenylobacterium sp.]|jgi:hypothetical protein
MKIIDMSKVCATVACTLALSTPTTFAAPATGLVNTLNNETSAVDPNDNNILINNVLTNGSAKNGLAGETYTQNMYSMYVPAGATDISFSTTGGTGDADMYISYEAQPTVADNDCGSSSTGNNEICTSLTHTGGTYFVMLSSHQAYDGITLVGSYYDPTDYNVLKNDSARTNLSEYIGTETMYTIDVPTGATDINFTLTGGTGDADLYVRYGAAPTTNTYDCRPWRSGSNESCNSLTHTGGTYFVMVKAYSAYSGVSLKAHYTELSSAPSIDSTVNNININNNQVARYSLEVVNSYSALTFTISGGSGEADLYVKHGATTTPYDYDCRPYIVGNEEACSIYYPASGTWYIDIRAEGKVNGLMLNAKSD